MATEFLEDGPGCFTSIKDSISKVGTGIVMILIAFPLLFWNEGRAVKRAQDLEFGQGAVTSIESDKVDSAKNGKLVHLSGKLTVNAPVVDPHFKVTANAVGLKRVVEMYQWKESKTKKKKKTKYSYAETWSSSGINSSSFKKKKFHNPPFPTFKSDSFRSKDVKLGAYGLGKNLIGKWPVNDDHTVTPEELASFTKVNGYKAVLDGNTVYFGVPGTPTVGDVRVSFKVGPPGDASVVAGLEKGVLSPFTSKEMNDSIALLETGTVGSAAMFQTAVAANETMTWILRLVGLFLMFMGFNLLFGPLDLIMGMIPFIGAVFDFGTTLIAGILAFGLTFITISVGWIFYRPLIGIPLFLLGVGAIVGIVVLAMKANKKKAAAAPAV